MLLHPAEEKNHHSGSTFALLKSYPKYIIIMVLFLGIRPFVYVESLSAQRQRPDSILIPPKPSMEEVMKDWGPNDSLKKSAIWYGSTYYDFKMMPYNEEENIWVSNLSLAQLAKIKADWARLRNAVYVVYPYAKIAGETINNIRVQLQNINDKSARKAVIKAKEKELKKQFADPLKNLSVYQGEILMKLINRQTGNDCYEILKEYKGWFNTNIYQLTALFYGGNLKQQYNLSDKFDHQIEIFVREIDANWYNNPFRK